MTVSIEYERSTDQKSCTAHVLINGRKWYSGSGSNEKEALESVIQNMARFITETIERSAKRVKR
jgi:dsRNA-specific ribonuclease